MRHPFGPAPRLSRRAVVATLVAAMILPLVATSAEADAPKGNEPVAVPMPASSGGIPAPVADDRGAINGIDISKWQHSTNQPIDFNAVATNVSFVYSKATEADNVTDPWFTRDYAGVARAGLYRGAYHYARPAMPLSTAVDQARHFVAVAGTFQSPRDLPPMLDVEANGGLSAVDLSNWVATWINAVSYLTGRTPVIYTGYYFWNDNVAGTNRFSAYPLWYARYNSSTQPGPLFGGWPSWSIWQWSSTGSVPGIVGNVDLDKLGLPSLPYLIDATSPPRGPSSQKGRMWSATWYLRNSATSGIATSTFGYGNPGDYPLTGDWNGSGTSGIGVFRDGTWYLSDAANIGRANRVVHFGDPGDIPVTGDWNGDGRTDIGVVRQGVWYLRSTLTTGPADQSFAFGNPGDYPVTGRWVANDRRSYPGVVHGTRWSLRNSTTAGPADAVFSYGDPGDVPVVGDWNGNGTDTIGVKRSGIWYLRNSLQGGNADFSVFYGDAFDIPLSGSFGGSSSSSIGVAR